MTKFTVEPDQRGSLMPSLRNIRQFAATTERKLKPYWHSFQNLIMLPLCAIVFAAVSYPAYLMYGLIGTIACIVFATVMLIIAIRVGAEHHYRRFEEKRQTRQQLEFDRQMFFATRALKLIDDGRPEAAAFMLRMCDS